MAQHSTLEYIHIEIFDDECRGDVASHIVRHTAYHPRFVVQSKRPDWTGKERPPSSSIRMFLYQGTAKALIDMARVRLCKNAMKETTEWMWEVKNTMMKSSDMFLKVLAIHTHSAVTIYYHKNLHQRLWQ